MVIFKQYFCLLDYRTRSMLKYPLDIILGISGTVLWHLPNFVILSVLFNNTQFEYEKGYLILLYGLSVFGDGIQHTFCEALWQFGNNFIKTAKFDSVLTKPVSDFVQVVTSRFDIDGLGGVLWGGFCCFYGYGLIGDFNVIIIAKIICAMLCAANIFVGINVCTSAAAFFIYDNSYLTHTIFQIHMFARYPKGIYPRWIGIFLSIIIPVFAATYYPVAAFQNGHLLNIIGIVCISGVFLILSVGFWNPRRIMEND